MFRLSWHGFTNCSWGKKIVLCGTSLLGGYCTFFSSKKVNCKHEKEKETEKQITSEDTDLYIYLPHDTVKMLNPWIIDRYPYWDLLELSKSENPTERRKAVESISKLFDLQEWQCQVIAQASTSVTAVGFARTDKCSPLFFLSPPFRNLKNESLNHDLIMIFLSLPVPEDCLCVKILVKQTKLAAKVLLKYHNPWFMELENRPLIYHSLLKKQATTSFHKASLAAILECSTIKPYRYILKQLGIFKTLLKIVEYHEYDLQFCSITAQILANFSMDENSLTEFHATGWIGILSKWARLSTISVNLPAIKALANLDKDDFHHAKYGDGVYLLSPAFRQKFESLQADIVFVHGLLGATFWTWRQSDDVLKECNSCNRKLAISDKNVGATPNISYGDAGCGCCTWCWPKDWLATDLKNVRLLGVDYQSCITRWNCKCHKDRENDSIAAKAKELSRKLLLAKVGERPIIWVAHSMGGLLVKQILVQAAASQGRENLLSKNSVAVVFYSVPHIGSEIASWFEYAPRAFLPSTHVLQLRKETPYLLWLHKYFKRYALQNNLAVLSFGETKKSSWGLGSAQLVTLDSSDPGFGDFYELPVEHLSTCKPVSRESICYSKVVEFLVAHVPQLSSATLSESEPCKNIMEFVNLMSFIP